MIKKWTQSDLKFCKNEGSIGSKIETKIDTKWKKLMQNP